MIKKFITVSLLVAMALFGNLACSTPVGTLGKPTVMSLDELPFKVGDVSGMGISEVYIGDTQNPDKRYFPGKWIPAYNIIVNASDEDTTWTLICRVPDNTRDGYVKAPLEVVDWITISDPNPTIPARSALMIPVSFQMPEDGKAPALMWEFWTTAHEVGSGTIVGTTGVEYVMNCRWLIYMKE